MLLLIVCPLAVIALFAAILYEYSAFWPWHLGKHHVIRHTNITYLKDSANPKHQLDVYLPKKTRNYPIIHFTHGGYWNSGDKNFRSWLTGLYGAIGVVLARRGVGVVIANYRLGPEVAITGQVADLVASIKWTLREAQKWDWNGKFYLMGHSAGGHLAALLSASGDLCQQYGLDRTCISGCIGLSPILDIPDMIQNSATSFNEKVSYPIFGKDPASWPHYSPIHAMHEQSKLVPTLFLYGSLDYATIATQVPAAAKAFKTITTTQVSQYHHGQLVSRFGRYHEPLTTTILNFIHTN